MENSWFDRTRMLIGEENVEKLRTSKVVVLGLGGVGGSCVEALCRSGIGNLMIVDSDKVEVTNLNRQVIATRDCVGQYKADVMARRLRSINDEIKLDIRKDFCLPDNSDFVFDFKPDYIIDAIDTVTTKIFFAKETKRLGIRFISCMGMGNRLDSSLVRVGKLADTIGSGCVLSKILRKKLDAEETKNLDVVYSLERPRKVIVEGNELKKRVPGSFACVPPVAGYFLASKVICDIIK